MSLIFGARTIAPFIYRNENFQGTLAFMGNDCSLTSTTCQVDSFKSGVPLSGDVGDGRVGVGVNTTEVNSTSVGIASSVTGVDSVAVGFTATAGADSVAVGASASASAANSVAIGSGVSNARANTVAVGTAGNTHALFEAPVFAIQPTSITTNVTCNSAIGRVQMANIIPPGTNNTFFISNDRVTANSIIIFSHDGYVPGAPDPVQLTIGSVIANAFSIRFSNTGAFNSNVPRIHFQVLNPA